MKLKALAAAVALVAAGNANAALTFPTTTGNGSLMFTSFDEVAGRSYFTELTANAGSTTAGVVRMDDILSNLGGTWTFTLNGLNTFYQGSTGTNVLAGIGAGDTIGTGAFANRRLLTSVSEGGSAPTFTNAQTRDAGTNLDTFAANCTTFPCTATSPSDTTYAGVGSWSASWGFPGLSSNSTDFDGPITWDFYLAITGTSGALAAPYNQVVNGATVFKATLNLASNTLTLTGADANPVPVPAAVWLLGSALLGMAGVGRRKA